MIFETETRILFAAANIFLNISMNFGLNFGLNFDQHIFPRYWSLQVVQIIFLKMYRKITL
jgi:hypothetical protein